MPLDLPGSQSLASAADPHPNPPPPAGEGALSSPLSTPNSPSPAGGGGRGGGTASSEQLYANRVRVYPRAVRGPVRRIKWAVLVLCLAVYYLAPWLRWDRGPGHPNQALLIDLPSRRGYFFAIEIWPQEVYYLAALMILGAVALFVAVLPVLAVPPPVPPPLNSKPAFQSGGGRNSCPPFQFAPS